MQKVILVGYMGAGKSYIGEILAKKINFPFLDLDKIIEKKENSSINLIFKNKGEIYFRKQEHLIFKELMESDQQFVLSLGGGTPCYANNDAFLNYENSNSIYLKTNIDTLVIRLKDEKSNRPLISHLSDDDLKEFIAKQLFERSYYYNKCNFNIDTSTKSATEIVSEIENLLA